MKAIYLRVSREDLSYDDQLPKIIEAFKLKPNTYSIFEEKESAYQEADQSKRTEFIKLKSLMEAGEIKEVYVYSLERVERNIQRMLAFFFFAESNGVIIYSSLQPYINNLFPNSIDKALSKNPIYLFLKYMIVLIYAFVGQNESFFTSERTKKAVVKGEVTTSTKGKKWGSKFNVDLPVKDIIRMRRRILWLKNNTDYTQAMIIDDIHKRFGVEVSKPYISGVKPDSE